jgi:hypothetical protein
MRLEAIGLQVDELRGNPLASSDPQSHDHRLARIDGHVAALGVEIILIVAFDCFPLRGKHGRRSLQDDRWRGKALHRLLDIRSKRFRQRNGDAIKPLFEHQLADGQREVRTPMDHRRQGDAIP